MSKGIKISFIFSSLIFTSLFCFSASAQVIDTKLLDTNTVEIISIGEIVPAYADDRLTEDLSARQADRQLLVDQNGNKTYRIYSEPVFAGENLLYSIEKATTSLDTLRKDIDAGMTIDDLIVWSVRTTYATNTDGFVMGSAGCYYNSNSNLTTAINASSGTWIPDNNRFIGVELVSGVNYVYRSFQNYDTSDIQDKEIVSARLYTPIYTLMDTQDSKTHYLTSSSSYPFVSTDYARCQGFEIASSTDWGNYVLGETEVINITRLDAIVATGTTKICFRDSHDINYSAVTTVRNYVTISGSFLEVDTIEPEPEPEPETEACTYTEQLDDAGVESFLNSLWQPVFLFMIIAGVLFILRALYRRYLHL